MPGYHEGMSQSPLRIQVEPRYLPDQSSHAQQIYTFAYTITVTNISQVAAQLIARHWMIEDASGHTQEVKGLGVIGKQPLLAPGDSFRYTSGCRLHAASGSMHGSFFVVDEHGGRFDVPVPLFVLEADAGGAQSSSARVLH